MKDMFVVKARDVGPLKSISIHHSAPPGHGGWLLSGVVVRNQQNNHEYVFECGKPLAEHDSQELRYWNFLRPGHKMQMDCCFCGSPALPPSFSFFVACSHLRAYPFRLCFRYEAMHKTVTYPHVCVCSVIFHDALLQKCCPWN